MTWTVIWVPVSGVLVMPPFADAAVGGGGVDWTDGGNEKRCIVAKQERLNVSSWGSGHLHKSTQVHKSRPGSAAGASRDSLRGAARHHGH